MLGAAMSQQRLQEGTGTSVRSTSTKSQLCQAKPETPSWYQKLEVSLTAPHTIDGTQSFYLYTSHHVYRYPRVRRLFKMIGRPAIRYAPLSAAAPDHVDHETAVQATLTLEDGSEEGDAEMQPMLGKRTSGSLDSVSHCERITRLKT
jgi:hypothetical protein